MIKRILIIAIASVALLLGTTMYAQKPEKKEQTKEPKGPRIVLEEMEVTLTENGKQVKHRVTKKEAHEMWKATYKKKRNEFGAKSFRGPEGRKLEDEFEGILRKSYSERKLDQKRLKVIDENGKVLKEISLKREVTKAKFWDKHKKRDWDSEKIITKVPFISDNKMFGAVVSNTLNKILVTPEFRKVYGGYRGGVSAGKLTVYNNRGEVQFEKQYPEDTFINNVRISDNGTVVAIKGVDFDEHKLHVYDRSGRETLVFPEGKRYTHISEPEISPNGKYLAVKIGVTVFFNTSTGTNWQADKDYIVREISDSGIVRVDYQDDPEKTIDLKEHLGE